MPRVFLVLILTWLVWSSLWWSGCTEPGSARHEADPSLRFSETTLASGLGGFRHVNGASGEKWFPETMGAGGGFLDYDGDRRLDIILVGGGVWPGHGNPVPALRVYRNEGDGTFTERTGEAGLNGLEAYGMGVSVADFDSDGDDDVFFTTLEHDRLLRNDDGVFKDVAREVGVTGPPTWSTSSVFFDSDRDGDLDLYVGSYVDWSPQTDVFCSLDGASKSYCTPHVYDGLPGRFYENDGGGRFEERTAAAGFLTTPQKTLGVVELDYNRDGWSDLVVANDMQPDLLYRNLGDGTFVEEGILSGIAFGSHGVAFNGMGVDAGVVDTTGEVTIFVGNFSGQPIGVFRHEGGGLFENRSAGSMIASASMPTLTFGLLLFDADLDGDLDLYAANGHVQTDVERSQDGVTFRQPSHLFRNEGDGTFLDAAPVLHATLAQPIVGRGAAAADYDGDGDVDLLVTENNGPAHLVRNETSGQGYLRVTLEGRRSNRDGMGARIVATAGGSRQYRMIRGGSSYLSQSEKTVTFGLGARSVVDSLSIHWPSGVIDRLYNVRANQRIVVEESSTGSTPESKYGADLARVPDRRVAGTGS